MRNTRRSKGQFRPEHLPAFYEAAGLADDFWGHLSLEQRLEEIAVLTWGQSASEYNKMLRQYTRIISKAVTFRRRFPPELVRLIVAADIHQKNPKMDLIKILSDAAEHGFDLAYRDEEAKEHIAAIEYVMAQGQNYRAKLTTQQLIEPVVRLLLDYDVKPSRKLPITRIAETMFDLFGIAPADRVSSATVQKVWRQEQATRKSNVHQLTKN